MTFAHPHVLWLLLGVPLVGVWAWWRRRGEAGLRYSDVSLAADAPVSWRARLWWAPAALRMAALALGICALARPQVENVTRTRTAEGIDIMLVLDTSSSMRAEDFDPNRFEAARAAATDFVDGRVSDRVGLIVFAAKAFTQVPLTLDYAFLQRMLERVRIGVVEDGTAIGTALATATNRLKETTAESKVVVLLTDGRNNRGEIDPVTAAEIAAALDVRVYAIGVGAASEGQVQEVPPPSTERQPERVDAEVLRTVASTTGGQYFSATSTAALQNIYDEIDAMEKTDIEERVYTDTEEQYPLFLWPAVLAVLLDVALRTTVLRRFP